MKYMLYGKNTAGSARGGVAMKTVSGKTGKPGRGGTAEPEGRRTAGQGGRFFWRLYSRAGTAGHFRRKRKIKEIQPESSRCRNS